MSPPAVNTILVSSEGLKLHLLSSVKKEVQHQDCTSKELHLIEAKLTTYDPEKIYTTIQEDLEAKYKFAAEYFNQLESIRKDLLKKGKLNPEKEERNKTELCNKLDQVVNTLRKDFSAHVVENCRLWDEVFLLKINEHTQEEVHELVDKVEKYLRSAEMIYDEEFRKMEKIYEILDEEGSRLSKNHDNMEIT